MKGLLRRVCSTFAKVIVQNKYSLYYTDITVAIFLLPTVCNTDSIAPERRTSVNRQKHVSADGRDGLFGRVVHSATSSFSSRTASYGASTIGPANCSWSSCWCCRDDDGEECDRRPPTDIARPLSGFTNTLDILPCRFSPPFSRP